LYFPLFHFEFTIFRLEIGFLAKTQLMKKPVYIFKLPQGTFAFFDIALSMFCNLPARFTIPATTRLNYTHAYYCRLSQINAGFSWLRMSNSKLLFSRIQKIVTFFDDS
jgi:hypothetical protein